MALAALAGACGRSRSDTGGPMTAMEVDRTVSRAIRSSNEGMILIPSKRAEQVYELPRLNEIAQTLRRRAALCFLERALQQMEVAPDTEKGFTGIPDGQAKLRVRINPAGKALRTELLESGFAEDDVPLCVAGVLEDQKWPENTSGNTHFIDVIYWVSLGMQPQRASRQFAEQLRREQAEAAVKAKGCLQGRVQPGSYTVEGVNLVGADGVSIANRVDQSALPDPVRRCLAQAFRAIRLPPESESFLRPVVPSVRFDVAADGTIEAQDEEWLHLVQLEERAKQAARRAELTGESPSTEDSAPSDGAGSPAVDELPATAPAAIAGTSPRAPEPSPQPEANPRPEADPQPAIDPRQGGIKLDLSGRR